MLPAAEKLHEIYNDLGMSEDKIDVDVKTIVEWMRKQPHLPDPGGKFVRLSANTARAFVPAPARCLMPIYFTVFFFPFIIIYSIENYGDENTHR